MNTGMKLLLGMVGAIITLIVLFFMMPLILEGVNTVNQTTNITEYAGLAELNNLSPAIIFALMLFMIFSAGFAWIFWGPIKRKITGKE